MCDRPKPRRRGSALRQPQDGRSVAIVTSQLSPPLPEVPGASPYAALARALAERCRRPGEPLEHLEHAALAAAAGASARGTDVPCAMLAAIRAVKPRRVTTAGVRRAAADGRRLMGRAPTVRELAAALGVSAEEIADAHLDPLTGPRSLPAPMARASIANARLDPRRPS